MTCNLEPAFRERTPIGSAVSGDLNGDGYEDVLGFSVAAIAGSSCGLESDYAAVLSLGVGGFAGDVGLLSVDVDGDGFDDAVAQAYPMYGETDEHAYVLWGGTDFLREDRVTVLSSGGPWGGGLAALVTEEGVLGFAAPLREPSEVARCSAESGGCAPAPSRPRGRLAALALCMMGTLHCRRARTSGGRDGVPI